ncbi:MAG TPA: hypothetical protein ENK07_09950, partial [Bacteroidetes bacterium]|nr:hypothetical protein [Bacteroidota bacterium]
MKEGRAVWISRWEWTGSHSRAGDQAMIRQIFDDLRAGHFNMAFFQVRGEADAFYRSSLEPWGAELTGTFGRDPGWDPLAYAVRIAHQRGIELHAWVNVFTMWRGNSPPPHTDPEHIYHLHYPDWVCYDADRHPMKLNRSYIFVSPANLEAREHIIQVCLDIISRYDVDGIHFDYIRYPGQDYSYDPVSLSRFRDPAENPQGLSWAAWQREQVSAFVREFYTRAMEIRPEVKVSAAVIGKYKAAWSGWDAYNVVYQDPKAWAREGTIDFICPMIYWPIGPDSPAPFERYVRQWEVDDPAPRPVLPGIAAYRYGGNLREIRAEIDTCRALGTAGQVMFSYESLDLPGYWDDLASTSYALLANVPASTWKDAVPPEAPKELSVEQVGRGLQLRWQPPPTASDGDRARYYNVYRVEGTDPGDLFDPAALVAITSDSTPSYYDTRASVERHYTYWVTALDDADNESKPSVSRYPSAPVSQTELPSEWTLFPPYPNPFNAQT